MTPKKKRFFFMNIGSSSMLLIFVLLCLVSFAVLSIVSANADRNLSRKITERTERYYTACNEAHAFLASTDAELAKQYAGAKDATAYFQAAGRDKSCAFPVSNEQALLVELEILYPESDQDTYYRIRTWKIVSTQ